MTYRKTTVLGLMLLLAVLALAGCNVQRDRSEKVVEDWSRGNRIGTASIRQPVGLAADDQGAYVMWAAREEEGTRLVFVHLGTDGLVQTRQVLPLNTFFPRLPQLVASDSLQGFVLTRLSDDEQDGVYHFVLDRDGVLAGSPERLSGAEQKSTQVDVVQGPDGTIHLLWDVVQGPSTGVYYLSMGADGAADGFPQLIGPGGEQPAGLVDEEGVLHVAWLAQRTAGVYDLNYATVEPAARISSEPVVVAEVRIPVTDLASALTLALDQSQVYVMWSQEHRSGLQQGTAELYYVAFPIAEPVESLPRTVLVSSNAQPVYTATDEYPPLTAVARPGEEADWANFVEGPVAFPQPDPPAALVLADMGVDFRFDPRPQVVLLMFQDGRYVAYQQPARTRQYSQHPRGAASSDGQLHMAWIDLEQPGDYSVYYASTRAEAIAALDPRTSNDTILDAADTLWGMASGITFVPLVGVVMIPVLLICGIFYITGNDDALKGSWAAQLTLGVTVVIYLGTKTLIMAGLVTRPPLLDAVPAFLQPVWWLIAMLIVALLAGLILAWYIRRSDRPYLFRAALTFCLVDAILTLLIYGPAFYGE